MSSIPVNFEPMVKVRVIVSLKPSLLDSAGRAVNDSLHRLGFADVDGVRIGRTIEFTMDAYSEERVREMCSKLLANPVTEDFRIEVVG